MKGQPQEAFARFRGTVYSMASGVSQRYERPSGPTRAVKSFPAVRGEFIKSRGNPSEEYRRGEGQTATIRKEGHFRPTFAERLIYRAQVIPYSSRHFICNSGAKPHRSNQ